MPSLKSVTAFMALMSIVLASPVDLDRRDKGGVPNAHASANATGSANSNRFVVGHAASSMDLDKRDKGGIPNANASANAMGSANRNGTHRASSADIDRRDKGGVPNAHASANATGSANRNGTHRASSADLDRRDKGGVPNANANANATGSANSKKFRVDQVSGKKYQKNGPGSMLQTYQKYGSGAPSDVIKAAAAQSSGTAKGSVAAIPEAWDVEYLSPVTVGGTDMMLDFDTGSADLWVFSNKMPVAQQSGHAIYDPAPSGTLKSGYTWNIRYGDGSGASGVVYADKVTIGGVTATSQAVEAATSVSSSFASDQNNDGLVGLSFSTINTVSPVKQLTFFDSIKSTLVSPLFTATLRKGAPGSYDFGYIDATKYTGSIAYAPVNSANGFWQFTSTGYVVGSGAAVGTSYSAIADTGTTLMYLPTSIVQAYYSKVAGAQYSSTYGGWIFPCASAMPSFSAIIGGQARTVPGSYINWAPISSTTCFGGMQYNTGIGFTIFGDVFLKSQFVVFDSSVPRIGFAQQK